MKYELTATSVSGASTTHYADTLKEVLRKFDSVYARKGFRIWIYKYDGNEYVGHKVIKSTYR